MSGHPLPSRRQRAAAGFSLIEVTLALGIVTFALVGVIGILPIAMNSSRQSIDKNRAAAIANTLFTSFRSQPFGRACYLTTDFDNSGTQKSNATDPLDLNTLAPASPDKGFYATFLDVATPTGDASDAFGKQRRLCFTSGQSGGGADYLVTMHFNNRPAGMVITPSSTIPAQANQIELVISPLSRPRDQYRFISLIANRTN